MAPKVVLVTGASNGIGYETVKAFLQSPNSYHVYVGTRSLQKGNAALQKIRDECPGTSNTAELLQIDINIDQSIEEAFDIVKNGQGRLDILINNAGKQLVSINLQFLDQNVSKSILFLRRRLRRRVLARQDIPTGVLQQGLRRERLRHQRRNLDICPPAAQVRRASPALLSRLVADDPGGRSLLPDAAAAGGLAQEDRLRNDRVPLQQDGHEHADAGLEPQAESRRGQGF